jgi:predicted acyltransferase
MSIPQRFTALDVFRGMTVCFMIIVNNQAGAVPFEPLEHASWHGFTPTDLVFPSFLFAVGNAMAFTMPKFAGMGNGQVAGKIFKRTFLIFLIGYLLSWYPFVSINAAGEWIPKTIDKTRIFGVLARIALCYGIAAAMIHFLSRKAVMYTSIAILLGYWLVMYLGGDYTMLGNVGIAVDKWLVGENHMYKGEGIAFEPEGFLSTFPAAVNVVIGYFAGVLLREKGKDYEGIAKVLLYGAALMAIAYCWNYSFPINKKIWTSSYVLYTCGISLLMIGSLVYLNAKTSFRTGNYFFEVFGKNPLFIYVLSSFIPKTFNLIRDADGRSLTTVISKDFFQQIAPGSIGALLYSIALMMVCWLVGYVMDRKRVYVRV